MKSLLTLCICIVATVLKAQQLPDTVFAINLKQPAFEQKNRPTVFIDGAHYNLHQIQTGFLPLARLLQADGYSVQPIDSTITTAERLKNCDVLVIANALNPINIGNWVVPNPSAFTAQEIEIIEQWVTNGGSLLLIADHMPFGGAVQDLGKALGAEWLNGFSGAVGRTWPPNTFYTRNNTLKTWGTGLPQYSIDSVATFTGSAIKLPQGAEAILQFTTTDTAYMCDTAWRFVNAQKQSLEGYVQGGVYTHGKGTVAVFAEAAMFTAQLVNNGQLKVGFNSPKAPQNAHFVLNIFHYLARNKFDGYGKLKESIRQNQ